MELPIRVEESVHRVATHSSIKSWTLEKSRGRKLKHRTRQSRVDESDRSSSDRSPDLEPSQPRATSKKGVEATRILELVIIVEVRK